MPRLHRRLTLILSFLSLLVCSCRAHRRRQEPIVGHILPHSHCDAAYKKTLDEYYETEVRNVLNSIMVALPEDPTRRFVWAETVFLSMWWHDTRTTPAQRATFRSVVDSSQLELVCGGWVMHDEAITRYDSQIHQMTHGHTIMMELLGKAPRTGYQIDPFGASSFSVLLHKWAGMDMILHNRIPHKDLWKGNQSLEFTWNVEGEHLWMHVYDTHYETRGFDWESLEVHSAPVTLANVQEQTDAYMNILQEKAGYYRTPHVLMPFGGDFRFQNASWQFQNMDMIVEYANAHPERYAGTTLRYTTVEEYYDVIRQSYEPSDFPVVEGSPFLPLWTGYYTTLPAMKQMMRACEMILRIVETQFAQKKFDVEVYKRLEAARETVYLMQHHDAIPGTSYRFVILDYMKRMHRSMNVMTEIISSWLLDNGGGQCEASESLKLVGGGPYLHETLVVRGTEDARSIHLDRVLDPLMGSDGIELAVFNSLAWPVDTLVSFVCSRSDVGILQGTTPVQSQATPLEHELDVANLGLFLITFRANVPPLGQSQFQVKVCDLTWDTFQDPPEILPIVQCAHVASSLSPDDVMRDGIFSDEMHVQFDSHTNDIASVTQKNKEQLSWKLSHDIVLYDGSNDDLYNMNTAPGEESDPAPLKKSCQIISAYKGPLFSQVTVRFNPWLTTRYRVVNGTDMASLLQVSVLSGPIPTAVNVASRFQTNLTKGSEWVYDENGFLPAKATYDLSEGVGGSVRPMVSRAWLQEESTSSSVSPRFTIYTADPRGVVSRHPGSLDIFWHRRNNNTNDWLKRGDDKSTVRSSVFLSFPSMRAGLKEGEADLLSHHRKLATMLANDVAVVASSRMQDYKNQTQAALSNHMHVVSFRKSGENDALQGEEASSAGTPKVWIEIQVENLSTDTEQFHTMDLMPLLHSVPAVVTENATLTSLTFLHEHNETSGADHAPQACRLEAGKSGELNLSVGSRQICSVRAPVSSTADTAN